MKDLLDILDKEDKQEKKEFKVEKSPELTVNHLLKLWESAIKQVPDDSSRIYDLNKYLLSIPNQFNFVLTKKNIEEFCLRLSLYQEMIGFESKSGYFLSALINNFKEQEIILNLQHFQKRPWYIGYKNKEKNIIINGNVGYGLGYDMRGGTITVNGNIEDALGSWLRGGIFYINGYFAFLSNLIEGGDIYHKGQLIVKNGKRI